MADGTALRSLLAAIEASLGAGRAVRDAPLAPLTTFRVGGAADALLDLHSTDELLSVIRLAAAHGVPLTVLGGGSNVLIHDGGIRGLVLRLRGGDVHPVGPTLVRADAGVTINGLVRWTINRGLAGLEAWAGTPGTVGGAVHGNAHWQRANIGDMIESVRLARRDGTILQVPADRMEFDYDDSRLKRSGEIVLWTAFRVTPGADPDQLRATARASLAYRKRTQPLASPSAGCIFMNPDPTRDPLPDGMPASAGALIDRAGLKGAAAGAARVSTTHGNFIINTGGASAADIAALIDRCRRAVYEAFGIVLREEIVRLGFPPG